MRRAGLPWPFVLCGWMAASHPWRRRRCLGDSATKSVTSLTVIVFEIVLRENMDREETRHCTVTLIFCCTAGPFH